MPKNAKGSRRERELLEKLSQEGLIVHRIAGSGVKDSAICDLIAVDSKGKVQLIEVKSRKKCFYTKEHMDQFNQLIEASKACKAKPVLAVKLNYKNWQFIDLKKNIPKRID
ncbi:MAG: hypothetical protein ISS95_01240 [Candidatus Aenigmarchaeota archaeon]|nr:hypothetical protein [Candidatus Aenigmarchaeota archaeon]